MLFVLKVYLEVGGRGIGPGRVELAGAVETLDAREEVEPDVWRDSARLRHLGRRTGIYVYSGVAHERFELVIRVYLFLLESIKGGYEPCGRGRL